MNEDPEIDPIADCYPPLPKREREELKEHIRVNGLQQPIVLYKGKILCGANRFGICKELGIPPQYITPEIADPITYAIGDNEKRRHLTQSQKAVVAEALATLQWGSNQYQEKRSLCVKDSIAYNKQRKEVAEKTGASMSTMDRVRIAKRDGGPHFAKAITNGQVSADEAYNISRLPKEEHEEALRLAIDRKPRDTVSPGRQRKAAKPSTPKRVITPEEKARRQELLERSKRSLPWPQRADARPIDPEGEVQTRQIRDAVVRLRNAEPQIGSMPEGEALRNVFSDTKKLYLFRGTIDPLLKAWSHDVNGKATARERLLYEARQRREDVEADEENKRLTRRQHKIHGFEAAWTRFEQVLKTALQNSVFCLADEEQLLSATTEFLTAHFNALRQRAAKSASADKSNASGEGLPKVAN